jgi:hypothetical protein
MESIPDKETWIIAGSYNRYFCQDRKMEAESYSLAVVGNPGSIDGELSMVSEFEFFRSGEDCCRCR